MNKYSRMNIFNETYSSMKWRDVRIELQPISTREKWQLVEKRHRSSLSVSVIGRLERS